MKKYKHIFFDLDDTLWDFKKNSCEALSYLFEKYSLENHGIQEKSLLDTFHSINDRLWKQYSFGKIDKEFLRSNRFKMIFRELGYENDEEAIKFGHEYLSVCPFNKNLVEGAIDLLDYLSPKYKLHVITNGFEEIAHIKLQSSGLEKYFNQVITSEKAGAKKPARKIFEFALQTSNALVHDSIMIGNDSIADIKGALDVGMDQIYFNPYSQEMEFLPAFQVNSLKEVMNYL